MRLAILITARLGSTRLSRKHLLPVRGKPILQFLVDAINREFNEEIAQGDVITAIATSEKAENQEFKKAINGCEVFAGADENIPLRHLQAADHFGAGAILSVDGDDILCAPQAMRAVYKALASGVAFAKTEGLPLGMNASGYSTAVLRSALDGWVDKEKLETGWGRIFSGTDQVVVAMDCDAPRTLRFTLDYEEDYRFFLAILAEPAVLDGSANVEKIIQIVLDRGLDKITQPIVNKYWSNFYSNIDKEENRGGKV